MKEIKASRHRRACCRAFSVYRDTRVWIDPQNHWLVIDAAASAKADEVIGLLAAHRPVPAGKPVRGPVARLGHDRLAGRGRGAVQLHHRPGHRTALVRRKRRGDPIRQHSIDADDVRRHIQSGKQCTRLAMTWADRISFVLTENLDVKRVAPLDVLKEGNEAIAANDDEKFDSDMMLMTGELAKLMAELVEALGGEKRV